MKPVTIILPSYCPDEIVRGYETRCLTQLAMHTPKHLYDLIVMQGGDWSYPQKVNAALSGSQSDFTVILSNDVFVGPGWLQQMLTDWAAIQRCGVLAPLEIQDGDCKGKVLYDAPWWALVLISRATWDDVGPLHEGIPHTYHDQDWNIRARQMGYQICRTGNVVVEHVNMATRSRVRADDSAEKKFMEQRWGTSEFRDWVEMNANSLSK